MKDYLLTALLGLLSTFLISQSIFQGELIDSKSGEPVEFANVFFLNNQRIGTLSRQDGSFRLVHPISNLEDTIVISSITYKHLFVPTSRFQRSTLVLELDEEIHELDEITVVPENQLVKLLHKVIDNVSKNYPNQKHRLHGFYQEYTRSFDEFTSYLDGLITMENDNYAQDDPLKYDPKYNNKRPQIHEEIYLHQLRRSEDYTTLPEYLEEGFRFNNISLVRANPVYDKSFVPFIMTHTQEEWRESLDVFVESEFLKVINLGFEISGPDTLQRIGILQFPIVKGKENEKEIKGYLLQSEWMVNLTDFGVVSIRQLEPDPLTDVEEGLSYFLDDYSEIQFRKINGTYFPTLIIHNFGFEYAFGTNHYFISQKFFVEQIEKSKGEFVKRKPSKKLSKKRTKRTVKLPYDEEFWAQFSIPSIANKIEQFEGDLNRGLQLNEQFKKNRKRK